MMAKPPKLRSKEMRDASEILGEVAAEAWAKTRFPNAEQLVSNCPVRANKTSLTKFS